MKKILAAAAFAVVGIGTIVGSASAMPAASHAASAESLLQTIAGGCGRGFHPNPWGRCVPNRYDDGPRYGYDNGYRPAPRYSDDDGYRPAPRYGYRPEPGYDRGPGYGGEIDRGGCPRGRHPGNSGRCVKD